MAFDGIVARQVVTELNNCLLGGKICKVYQPGKNELLLDIYANSKHYTLLINIDSNCCRMHLTTYQKPNPFNAPNFCMLLRKYLIGMKIKNFTTYDLERIITIELEGYDELNDLTTKELVIELMGKHSNVILLNNSSNIIDSMRHIESTSTSTRDIMPARKYVMPQTTKQSFLNLQNFEEFYNILSNKNDITSSICNNFTGISKSLILYLLQINNIDNASVSKNDYMTIYNALKLLVNSSNLECVKFENQNKGDYVVISSPTPLQTQVNFFLDDFYHNKEIVSEFTGYRNNVLKLILNELKKYTKRLSNINQKLEECNNKDTFRIYGELITANLYQINSNQNADHIVLTNYYDNNNELSIPLDKSVCISENAKRYFKKYTKLKKAFEIVTTQKEETKAEIDYIESVVYELECAKTVHDIDTIYTEFSEEFLGKNISSTNKKKKQVKNKTEETFSPITFNIDGYTVLVGRNNKQNDFLTLKYAHSNDLWFHTKDIHGSHVVLKTNKEEIAQETINKCASLCAFYSKAKNSSNVPVDYTFIRYVKKASGAKPGMVIYTNFQTVNVQPQSFDLYKS
jgi:predicted ribosome quality control (RQC) complex YloA/Tae2 family protein